MGGSNVWVNGKKAAAMGNPALMLDARVPASYSGSGSDWNNLAIDGTQATFDNAPGFDDGAIVFDGSTRANMNLLDITFTYNGDWSIELLITPEPTQAMYAGVFGDHDCSGTTGMVMQQRGGRNNGYYFGTGSSSALSCQLLTKQSALVSAAAIVHSSSAAPRTGSHGSAPLHHWTGSSNAR